MELVLQKSSKKHKAKNLILWLIAGIGILLILTGLYFDYQRKVLSFYVTPEVTEPLKQLNLSAPTNIKIEGVGIDIAVSEGRIINGIWEISDDTASYLNTSSKPGGGGNIVIYGHNRKHIFGNLVGKAKAGQIIELISEDGKLYSYKVEEVRVVEPADIDVVLPTDYEVLTVYTCIGILNSDRLVLKALPF